jgi:hypothetical protein
MLGNEKYDKKLVLKSKKIGLEEAQKRRESLMSICETAEREGFNVDVKSYFSDEKKMGFDGGCVCPKFAGLDESIKHLMMGQQVEFVVKSNQGGSGHVLDSVVDSTCQFGHSPSIRLKFSAGDEYPEYRKNLISNLREIIGATGAKIEPDNIISLSEYVGTPISEYVAANLSQLLAPIGNGLHYASHKGDDFVTAIKNGLINIDKKIDPDKYRIKDVLKEGHAHGGDHCSCVYIMNSENTKSEE